MQKLNLCKEVLENALRVYQNMEDCEMEISAFEIASAQAIEELLKYREIGTLEECRSAMEKQKAMKPVKKSMTSNEYKYDFCPICGGYVSEKYYKNCSNCGQKLDWELEGENEVAAEYNNGWIPVSERMPKSEPHDVSDEVLVAWKPKWNNNIRLVSTAVYIEEHTVTTDDMNWHDDAWEELERCEDKDAYWILGGWYETVINTIDDVGYIPIDGYVIAWQPLPEVYRGESG